MRWLAIAFVIAGCAEWREISIDDVRSGRESIEGKPVEIATKTRTVELRSVTVAGNHLVGRTLYQAPVDIAVDDVVRLRIGTGSQIGYAVLWTVLAIVVVAALITLGLLSEGKPQL